MAADMKKVPEAMLAIHQEDTLCVTRLLHRKNKIRMLKIKEHKFTLDITNALSDVEIRGDALHSYLEDFLKDNSEVKLFERRLQKISRITFQPTATKNAPSRIKKKGPYSMDEINLNYDKVMFKMESLQTLAEKAVAVKSISTQSVQSKKQKHNKKNRQANTPSFPSLSQALHMIIADMECTLEYVSSILETVNKLQLNEPAFAAHTEMENRKDFSLLEANAVRMHDLIEDTQKKIYEEMKLPYQKKKVNPQIRSLEQYYASVKKIEMRLEKMTSVSFVGKINNAKDLIGTQIMGQLERLHIEDQADLPQAGPSHAEPKGPRPAARGKRSQNRRTMQDGAH